MTTIHTLDLKFQDNSQAIAAYLIESNEGLILIESGPESTFSHLEEALHNIGFSTSQVKHVLLTHIHFDHAGAAWKFAEIGAKVYVHPMGLPHLQNPEKLWNSAAQIYGDAMEQLWGKMQPISKTRLVAVSDNDTIEIGNINFKVIYTPGHAVHHNAYVFENVIFTGDVAGVKIENGPVVPPCPPPDINIEAWKKSINKIKKHQPKALYLTHYGRQTAVQQHLAELEKILDDWSMWMKVHFDAGTPIEKTTELFKNYISGQYHEKRLVSSMIKTYEYANPAWMSVAGLLRYWKLKSQGRL